MESEFILNYPDLQILLMIIISLLEEREDNLVTRHLLELHLIVYEGEIRTYFLRFNIIEHYFNGNILCTFYDFLPGQLSIAMN